MARGQILVVDDEADIRQLVGEILQDEGYEVVVAENGEQARVRFASQLPDLVLLDIWMPDIDGITLLREWATSNQLRCPVVMMSGHGSVETAVEATQLGATAFVEKPISLAKLLATVRKAISDFRGHEVEADQPESGSFEPLGNSLLMQQLREQAAQAAQHGANILICGEPGSGRENLALHIYSLAESKPDWAALDPSQLHTDQTDIAAPDNTTFYIRDVHSLEQSDQQRLSEWLEGLPKDNQVIATASNSLEALVRQNKFSDELYFRLNVLRLEVPPLRERPDDVPELVRFYADYYPNQENLPYRHFSVAAQNRLRTHSWPGNVRELRNLIRRLLILGGAEEVSAAEIEQIISQNPIEKPVVSGSYPEAFDLPLRNAREEFEREYLIHHLRRTQGSVGKLAEVVGMERTHLYRKLRALGIDPKTISQRTHNQ